MFGPAGSDFLRKYEIFLVFSQKILPAGPKITISRPSLFGLYILLDYF